MLTDIAHAKTGSGKTLAFVLPVIEKILQKKQGQKTATSVYTLVLVPTKELAEQITKVFTTFTAYCTKHIRVLNLATKASDAVQRALLAECPDIVIATPARACAHLPESSLDLSTLPMLVVDEADLVLSFGHEKDVQTLVLALPANVQSILMSATLRSEVDALKDLFCKDPAVLHLTETQEDNEKINQFVVKCGEDEKFLLIYVIVKLKLIKGKMIIFVADVDRSYRLKLFFEQFGIKSCVLNSELPVNSRLHTVEAFNKNVYDIIIAADENEVVLNERPEKKRKVSKDKEFGVSRGIDFKNVACVLNFDLPISSKSYTHRIGRTGRAGQTGMALSFVIPADRYRLNKHVSVRSTENDEEVLASIVKSQNKKGYEIKDYAFDMAQVDSFRYRMNDALKAVTRVAVREARTRELRNELINSEKLKRHFEENPEDLYHLRHDSELKAVRVQPHLKHVPDYLLPEGGRKAVSKGIGFVGLKGKTNKERKASRKNKGKFKGGTGKRTNPLKSFSAGRK